MAKEMKCYQVSTYDGDSVRSKIKQSKITIPAPAANEIRVRVYATSINAADHKLINWKRVPISWIPGTDVAGVVDAVGPNVSKWKVGDEVAYCGQLFPEATTHYSFVGGSQAEYHIVQHDIVALKPKNITFLEAATLGMAGLTAWDMMLRVNIRPGERVLVCGAGGGVGTYAVQMAIASGATVYAVTGTASVETVKSLGANEVWDYKTTPDWVSEVNKATGGVGVDVVLDIVGSDYMAKAIGCTKRKGRMCTVCGGVKGDFGFAFLKNITIHFDVLEFREGIMDSVADLASTGHIKAVIHSVLQFDQLPEAMELAQNGSLKGSVVVQIHPDATKKTVNA